MRSELGQRLHASLFMASSNMQCRVPIPILRVEIDVSLLEQYLDDFDVAVAHCSYQRCFVVRSKYNVDICTQLQKKLHDIGTVRGIGVV